MILGIPYDGTVKVAGCRLAPKKIYDYLSLGVFFDEDTEYKEVEILNYSDLISLKMVEEVFCYECIENKKKVLSLGGNHIITLPIIKSLCETGQNISLLYFDAHSDADQELNPSNSSFIAYIKTEYPLLKISNIGLRFMEETIPSEINYWTTEDIYEKRIEDVLEEIIRIHKNTKVYVSVDLDVLDPGFAPGVSAPIGAGLLPYQVKKLIKGLLKSLDVIGMDIVEYNPYLEVGTITLSTIYSLLLTIKKYWIEERK